MVTLEKILTYFYYCTARIYFKWDKNLANTAKHLVSIYIFGPIFGILNLLRIITFDKSPILNENLRFAIIIFVLSLYFTVYYFVGKHFKSFSIDEYEKITKPSRKRLIFDFTLIMLGAILVLFGPMLLFYNN